MNYFSFFSGIGTFEYAIHQRFPKSHCLGFSEIDADALHVYGSHFSTHPALGDITKITEQQIKDILAQTPCHLVVGGFPCQDLSSLSRAYGHQNHRGLEGSRSGLFFYLERLLQWIIKHNKHHPGRPKMIIENNGSMTLVNQEKITQYLKTIDPTIEPHLINSHDFGLQRRRRIFWTNFELPHVHEGERRQTWKDVLLPSAKVKELFMTPQHYVVFNKTYPVRNSEFVPILAVQQKKGDYIFQSSQPTGYRSRWQMGTHSDMHNDFVLPVARTNNFLIVRTSDRSPRFRVRKFHPIELERLFFLPDGYVSRFFVSRGRCERLLGNAIVVEVIVFLLHSLE